MPDQANDKNVSQSQRTAAQPPQKRKRRWLRITLIAAGILIVLLALLVILLPSILSSGMARRAALAKANSQLNGKLDIADWSIGWGSGFSASNISLTDKQGEALLQVKSVRMATPLLALMGSTKKLGTIEVDSPRIKLAVLPNGGTNLQEIVGKTPQAPSQPSAPVRLPFDVQGKFILKDAEIEIKTADLPKPATIRNFNAEMNIDSLSKPVTFSADAELGEAKAPLAVKGQVTPMQDGVIDPEHMKAQIEASLKGLDLAEFAPAARAFGSPFNTAGTASMMMKADVEGTKTATANIDCTIDSLAVSGGPLGMDQPHLEYVKFLMDVSSTPNEMTINSLKFDSPVASAEMSGAMKPPAPGAMPSGQLKLTATADLAKIANMLPDTLKLQKGLVFETGKLDVNADVVSADNVPRIDMSAKVTQVSAQKDGRAIALGAPIVLDLSAEQPKSGPKINKLTLQSSFAQAEASGDMQKFTLTAKADLDELTREAAKFADLGGRSASGKATLTATAERVDENHSKLSGEAAINDLNVAGFTPQPVPIKTITMNYSAVAAMGPANQLQDVAVALVSPIAKWEFTAKQMAARPGAAAPVIEEGKLTASADLAKAVELGIRAGAAPAGLTAEGNITLSAAVASQGNSITVNSIDVQGKGLSVAEDNKKFVEPELKITGAMEANPATRTAELKGLVAEVSFGKIAVTNATLKDWAAPQSGFTADIAGNVNLEALRKAAGDFMALPADTTLKGDATMDLHVTGTAPAKATLNTTLTDVKFARPNMPAYEDKKATFTAESEIDFQGQKAVLKTMALDSALAKLQGSGSLSDWAKTKLLEMHGTLSPNWANISPLVATMINQPVTLAGKQSEPFDVKVSLASTDLAAMLRDGLVKAGMKLDNASVAGVDASNVVLAVNASSGKAQADANGGLLSGSFNLPLRVDSTEKPALTIPPNTAILTKVTLNEGLANNFLSKVSPVFSGAVNTSGVIGITMYSLNAPLHENAMKTATAKADLDLSNVAFSSAGVLGQLTDLLGMQKRSLLYMPNQRVAVELKDGRMIQGPLTVSCGGYSMTISGSMGVDGTLDMVAEIPVTRELLGKNAAAYDYVKGQTIKVPIRGTVANPKVSSDVFRDNLKALLSGASKQVIEKEGGKLLEKGLQKFLK